MVCLSLSSLKIEYDEEICGWFGRYTTDELLHFDLIGFMLIIQVSASLFGVVLVSFETEHIRQ